MRNLLWQSEAWKEYESLQAEKAILKKVPWLILRKHPKRRSEVQAQVTLT